MKKKQTQAEASEPAKKKGSRKAHQNSSPTVSHQVSQLSPELSQTVSQDVPHTVPTDNSDCPKATFVGLQNDDEPTNKEVIDSDEVHEDKAVGTLTLLKQQEVALKEELDTAIKAVVKLKSVADAQLAEWIKKFNKLKNKLEDFIYKVTAIGKDALLYQVPIFLKKVVAYLKKVRKTIVEGNEDVKVWNANKELVSELKQLVSKPLGIV